VDEDRAGLGVADVLEDGQEMVEIVSVDRPDIVEAELLEMVPPVQNPRANSSALAALS